MDTSCQSWENELHQIFIPYRSEKIQSGLWLFTNIFLCLHPSNISHCPPVSFMILHLSLLLYFLIPCKQHCWQWKKFCKDRKDLAGAPHEVTLVFCFASLMWRLNVNGSERQLILWCLQRYHTNVSDSYHDYYFCKVKKDTLRISVAMSSQFTHMLEIPTAGLLGGSVD